MSDSHVIFIGGRSGVGKSTVAFAMHDLLSEREIQHAVIEGDFLDLAYPAPWSHRLAEQNLAAMWTNYRALGYRRLIYTNTVSILETDSLLNAIGSGSAVTSVLLRASDTTAEARLGQREQGVSLQSHIERSAAAAARLDQSAADEVHRIDTDGKTPIDIARQILTLAGWLQSDQSNRTPQESN